MRKMLKKECDISCKETPASDSCQQRKQPPILVTGIHRSGTTWVGRMLENAPGVWLLYEPFNPTWYPKVCSVRFRRWFQYVDQENEDRFLEPLRRAAGFAYPLRANLKGVGTPREAARRGYYFLAHAWHRLLSSQALFKDPIAFFSAPWLRRRLGATPVICIRHPAAFASSIMNLNWQVPFPDLASQPRLMERLEPFAGEIRQYASQPPGILEQACLFWRVVYWRVLQYQKRHPHWIYIRYEELCEDPEAGFRELFSRLNLQYTGRAAQKIREHSRSYEAPKSWEGRRDFLFRQSKEHRWVWKNRLDASQIASIRRSVEDVSSHFYGPEDW